MFFVAFLLPNAWFLRVDTLCPAPRGFIFYFAVTLALLQVVVIATAVLVASGKVKAPPGNASFGGVSFVAVILLGGLVFAVEPLDVGTEPGRNVSRAMGALRQLSAAIETYKANCKTYPAALSVLGPPLSSGASPGCERANLASETLASGNVTSGRIGQVSYVVTYRPETAVDGRYTLDARPNNQDGRIAAMRLWNLILDADRVVRWTCEDRPATSQDPAVQ